MEKRAKKEEDIKASDVGKAGAGLVAGKMGLNHGAHRVLGLRGETHTTTGENAKKIKNAGNVLDPNFGGTGASKASPDMKGKSKNFVHVTGYNDKTPFSGTKGQLRFIQGLQKKFQRGMYSVFSHNNDKVDSLEGMKEVLDKNWKKGIFNSKTFHVMGSEDFYNKNFTPDPDDMALKSKKKVNVSSGKLRATAKAFKEYGFSGLKSSPVGRPILGAGLLGAGAYGTAKLTEPLREKIKGKMEKKGDLMVGRKDEDGAPIAGGIFIGTSKGHKEKTELIRNLVQEKGSLQKAKAAYTEKYPNDFSTVAIKEEKKPNFLKFRQRKRYNELTKDPRILLYVGKSGGPIQSEFYDEIFHTDLKGSRMRKTAASAAKALKTRFELLDEAGVSSGGVVNQIRRGLMKNTKGQKGISASTRKGILDGRFDHIINK